MASSGAAAPALRHSFMTPTRSDHDATPKKLTRAPSLPSQFKNNAPKTKQKKRPSGLFESSSDSGSDSSSHEPSPTQKDSGSAPQRRKSYGVLTGNASTAGSSGPATRHHHSLGMQANSRENSANNDRKGLFEFDDDAADSVETLRERVKLRQKKKEHEILNLRSELEAALARVSELESELQGERREKDEFAIRMNECQRLIEKRTKQLIKANEKLARLTEQSESRIGELQLKISELTLEAETARSQERSARDRQRIEHDEKMAQQRQLFEAERERTTLDFAEKMRKKEAEESALRKRVVNLEEEVVTVTSRIAESAEYQTLLKRCEDAEAISRGLRFQLEKAQNEKKFLKKQVAASSVGSQASNASPAFMASADLFADLASTELGGAHSPTNSVASEGLSSFDFFPGHTSPPRSPLAAQSPPQPQPQPQPSAALPRKPSLKILTGSNIRRSSQNDQGSRSETSSKQSGAESVESIYGSTDDGDAPPPPPTLSSSQSEKTDGKARPGSGSINFFEKISIKFKRSASSPRNASASTPAQAKMDDTETKPSSLGSFSASSQSQSPPVTSPIDIPSTTKKQGLPKRPKMYVAKSPSDYEESSDSIFGSDSDSDVSSVDDDANDEPPPPPPGVNLSRSRSSPSRSVDLPSMPPPPPPLFGDASDDDSSLSDADTGALQDGDLRRVILPMPASPPRNTNQAIAPQTSSEAKPTSKPLPSSSDESDSERSDSDTSEDEKRRKSEPAKQPRADAPKEQVEASSSSEFEDSDADERSKRRSRKSAAPDGTPPRKEKRDRTRSGDGDAASAAAAKVNRMNEYMEARARKQNEKLKKKEEHESAKHKEREEYEKEWERMAQEERERRRKQQKVRRTGKRRPSSMKTVRVSQMRQQMGKHQQKDAQAGADDGRARAADESEDDAGPPRPERQRSDYPSSDSDVSEDDGDKQPAFEAPLPPEPTAADTELYIRQQARLRERHEMEMKKKQDAEEADQVRGQIHRRVEMWAFGKELLHMILTLDQISTSDALRQCQLMVVQSPDPETLRKAYRNIIRVIHPDKLRGATISEQLEAKELFTVLNQAFDKFKAQNA